MYWTSKANMTKVEQINKLLDSLEKSKFRGSFHLNNSMKDYVREKGLNKIASDAYEIVEKRLSPAIIANDGRQTPMKQTHPVFIAQHATATCCRECIRKWHKMQPGRELSQVQQDYLVDVIMTWIEKELARAKENWFEYTDIWYKEM